MVHEGDDEDETRQDDDEGEETRVMTNGRRMQKALEHQAQSNVAVVAVAQSECPLWAGRSTRALTGTESLFLRAAHV